MGKCGSCCCCCCRRGCCCDKRDMSVLIGLLLAAVAVAVPIVLHETNDQVGHVVINYIRGYLKEATETIEKPNNEEEDQLFTATPKEKYRLAIFQLLTDAESCLPHLGLIAFGLGCTNAPLSLLLVCSALFRLPCGLALWLSAAVVQLVAVGLPLLVFAAILILYVAAQLHLYIEAACAATAVAILYLMALIVWLTVLGCYNQMKQGDVAYRRYGGGVTSNEAGYQRRSNGGSNGQQRRSAGYQLRHYYPPHTTGTMTSSSSSIRQLPPLPHHN